MHASRGVDQEGERNRRVLIPFERVDFDRDPLDADAEVFLLEAVYESAFPVENLGRQEDILGSRAFRVGRNDGLGRLGLRTHLALSGRGGGEGKQEEERLRPASHTQLYS